MSEMTVTSIPDFPDATQILSGVGTVTNSVTPMLIATVPANRIFIGQITVQAANAVTTATIQNATITVTGGTSAPAGTIMHCLGTRDTAVTSHTQNITIVAGSSPAAINLVLGAAVSTFSGSATVNGTLY